MSLEYIRTIPSSEHLKALLPVSSAAAALQKQKVEELKSVLSGQRVRRIGIRHPLG